MKSKRRVIILGGGMGGLSAAYALTQPEVRDAFDVTVYQMGWRLGGKGASSRNPAFGHRIEEHGLHLWMGCYENAFRILRDAYDAIERPADAPIRTWTDALKPRPITVLQNYHQAQWTAWPQSFPVLDTRPGEHDRIACAAETIAAAIRWVIGQLGGHAELLRFLQGGAIERVLLAIERGASTVEPLVEPALLPLVKTALRTSRALLHRGGAPDGPDPRRAFLTLDFMLTNALGILEDRLAIQDDGQLVSHPEWLRRVERVDHLDYRAWLTKHGAHADTTDSAILRGFADAVFSTGRTGAAGTALNGMLRLNMTYRGSVFYQMQGGMGEIVFAPLYEMLAKRGVNFQFFHRVDALRLDERQRRIYRVEMARQVDLKQDGYRPLAGTKLPYWPVSPDWNQIENGEALRKSGIDLEDPRPVDGETAIVEEDFDAVVLAIPVAALGPMTKELQNNRRYKDMLTGLATAKTQAVQLWFDRSSEELGWPYGEATTTAYVDPFDTWADMSHLLAVEDWGGRAKSCAYLVGSLLDQQQEDTREAVEHAAQDWLQWNLSHLMPGAMVGDQVDWRRFVDPQNGEGPARLRAQYSRANVRPSEQYTLSVAGSSQFRLRSHQSGFDNLYLAGDWTKTGMNVGSIEAAAMSGLKAGRAIAGDDTPVIGDYED